MPAGLHGAPGPPTCESKPGRAVVPGHGEGPQGLQLASSPCPALGAQPEPPSPGLPPSSLHNGFFPWPQPKAMTQDNSTGRAGLLPPAGQAVAIGTAPAAGPEEGPSLPWCSCSIPPPRPHRPDSGNTRAAVLSSTALISPEDARARCAGLSRSPCRGRLRRAPPRKGHPGQPLRSRSRQGGCG